jgi:putative Mg2+ transporter-C (MgtC) family protein
MSAASVMTAASFSEPFGQGWPQIAELGLAVVLSAAVGLERELRQKAAGLRTYTTVGLGAALFMLVSKFGFSDVAHAGLVVLDPSRVAAQIVSGLGFIGAGVIFVHRGSVQGLTTAATIWLTAAVGACAAAGLPVLAVLTTAAYFFVGYVLRPLANRLPALRSTGAVYVITYRQGHGLLRDVLDRFTHSGFSVSELRTLADGQDGQEGQDGHGRRIEVRIDARGRGDADQLAVDLSQVPGVLACSRIDSKDRED